MRTDIFVTRTSKPICTNLTSDEIFSLAVVGILTADVYTEYLLYDGENLLKAVVMNEVYNYTDLK